MAFDPTEHTVVEVLDYLDQHPGEVQQVYSQELDGKNRSTLMLQLEQRINQIPPEQADSPAPILPDPNVPGTVPGSSVVRAPSLGPQELLEDMTGGTEPTPRLSISVSVDDMTATAEIEGLTEAGELDWGDGTMVEVNGPTSASHTYDNADVYLVVVKTSDQGAASTAAAGGATSTLLPTNGENFHGMVRGTDDPDAFLLAQQGLLR